MYLDCPYCRKENLIEWIKETNTLFSHGKTECKCDYCNEVFEIYAGKGKHETRKRIVSKGETFPSTFIPAGARVSFGMLYA